MKDSRGITRREALGTMAGVAGAAVFAGSVSLPSAATAQDSPGRVKHSACRWCYQKIELEELCNRAKAVGVQSIELLREDEWPVVQGLGLECAVAYGATGIGRGWNDETRHDSFVEEEERLLPIIAAANIPTMICFSGLRRKIDDAAGLKACAKGLKRIVPAAEAAGVTIIMELLNSNVDHPYYQCDTTAWGVKLVDEVGSDRFKLLFDIYHMATMEEDVMAMIGQYGDYFAHYHTGGVPGRNEIDDSQTLDYPAIVKAIYDAGYAGYLGQEFIPTWDDPIEALGTCVSICEV